MLSTSFNIFNKDLYKSVSDRRRIPKISNPRIHILQMERWTNLQIKT